MTNIKHFLMMILLMLCIMMFSTVYAESDLVAITQLPQATSPLWQQTYKAYGRTIDVDVEVYIPATETTPILNVTAGPSISEPLSIELAEEYEEADKNDKVYSYVFTSDIHRTYIEHACPPMWGKNKREDQFQVGMREHSFDLIKYDENQAYADNNTLTVKDAIKTAEKHINDFFPDMTSKIRSIYVSGETFSSKGKTIRKQGCYILNLSQCLKGIPFMAEIRETYTKKPEWEETNWESEMRGKIYSEIYNDNSWVLIFDPYQINKIILEDVSLLPFDSVKDKIEMLITNGFIRQIFSVTLGYVQFDTTNPNEQILFPCWVTWCEYHPDGPQSEAVYGINDSELMFDGNNSYYRPIIINAHTGEMIDPENMAENRFMCPDFSTYE